LIAQSQDNVPKAALDHLTSAVKLVDNFIKSRPTATQIYDKAYFWIFEFGIVEHSGQRKVLGAGLLSSLSEFHNFATSITETIPFSMETILASTNISSSQNAYLVVDSTAQYFKVLNTLDESSLMPELNSAGRHVIH
jgi:phenylalanine-4-hydroxylase